VVKHAAPLVNSTFAETYSETLLLSVTEIKPNQVRLGEHSDYCTLSLVFQRDVGGLQVINSLFCNMLGLNLNLQQRPVATE